MPLRLPALLAFVLLATSWAGVPESARACPSDLDPTFGIDGIANEVVLGEFEGGAVDLATTADGSVVLVGTAASHPAVLRYLPSGEIDKAFGEEGTVVLDAITGGFSAVALQADGRIVAAGYEEIGPFSSYRFLVARFEADGGLDDGFGTGGVVTARVGSGFPRDVVVRGDGEIVAIGQGTPGTSDYAALAVFFTPDGVLDARFSDDGILDLAPDMRPLVATSGVLVEDDAIVFVGFRTFGPTVLVKLRADGSPDPEFGNAGRTVVRSKAFEEAWQAGLDDAGRIYVSGQASPRFGGRAIRVYSRRFTSNGRKDPGYGTRGKATVAVRGEFAAQGLAVGGNGAAVVAGWFPGSRRGAALVRFTDSGERDLAFGRFGIERFRDFRSEVGFVAAALDEEGRLLAAGWRDGYPLAVRYEGGAWDGVEECVVRCGNGVVGRFEQCDDGNTLGGDGCSAACQLD